jgi:DNA polymerase-4
VARVAASVCGAPGVLAVAPERVSEFLQGQSLEHLPGVGAKTRERLRRYGLRTVGELAGVPQALLLETFGAYRGLLLWRLARGEDVERLKVKKEVSSLSRETTLPEDTLDLDRLEAFVAYLCGRVALDLRRRKLAAHRMSVRVTYSDGLQRQMNQTLSSATNLEMELAAHGRPLLGELLASRRVRVQQVGVTVSRLRPSAAQPALFDVRGFERQEAVAEDVVRVRGRYGFNSLLPARAHKAVA